MRTIILLLVALLVAAPAFAGGQWSTAPDSNSTPAPTRADRGQRAYYRVTDTTDSGWLSLGPHTTYTICLDPDDGATATVAQAKINRAISADTANGSYVLNNVTLTGVWPTDCIYDVPGGRSIQVDMIAPSANNAIISVEAN